MKTMLRVIFFALLIVPLVSTAHNGAPVIIDFSGDQTQGCNALSVTFTDESFENAGDPFVSWLWDFGDGTTSTTFSPTHHYSVPGVYDVKLSVTSQSGWTGSATKTGYVKIGTMPVVDLGPDTTTCIGNAVILDAETPGCTYLWSDGTTTPQLETFFDGEYSVKVFRYGCVAKDTINVQQGAILYADFDYTQTGSCTPVATQFTEYSEACSGSVVQWTWDFGDGTTSTDRNPLHNYLAPGDYTVSLTVKKNTGAIYSTNKTVSITGNISPVVELGTEISLCDGTQVTLSAGNPGATYSWSTGESTADIDVFDGGMYRVTVTKNGCSVEDSVNVVWTPVLWSDFSFTKISGCLPVNMQFSDKSTACESTITNWFWEFGDGVTSTLQNPTHIYTSEGQFAVKLTITDNNGSEIKRSKKVIIEPVSFTVDLGQDTTICFGESVTLSASQPGATYLWNTGETSPAIDVFDDGDYSVTVNVDGCEVKDTVSVKTTASAIANWSASVNGSCLPVSVSFSDSSKLYCGQTITGWRWDLGDGTISTQQYPVHEYQTADSFTVRLTITSSNGNMVSKTKKIFVNNAVPKVDLPQTLTTCSGGTVELDAGIDDAQYTWTPSASLNAAAIRNPTARPVKNTWYAVTVTKCMVTSSDSVYVTLDSISKPLIRQEGNFLKATESYAYQWYREGKPVAGAIGRTLRVDHAGYYSVKAVNHSGCENESAAYFYVPVSSREKEEEGLRIKCSPNPTSGLIRILLSEIPEKAVPVTVMDAYGNRLFTTTIKDHVNTLNGLRLGKGMYFIEVIMEKQRKMLPVVIQ